MYTFQTIQKIPTKLPEPEIISEPN